MFGVCSLQESRPAAFWLCELDSMQHQMCLSCSDKAVLSLTKPCFVLLAAWAGRHPQRDCCLEVIHRQEQGCWQDRCRKWHPCWGHAGRQHGLTVFKVPGCNTIHVILAMLLTRLSISNDLWSEAVPSGRIPMFPSATFRWSSTYRQQIYRFWLCCCFSMHELGHWVG